MLNEFRVHRPAARLTDRWRQMPVAPRGDTRLGITFRPLQARDLGLDPGEALRLLLDYPYEVIRIPAYWDRLEPAPGEFLTPELDRVLDAAEQAGKQIILGVGAVKNFGYPEFFVPAHQLDRPLPEGALIRPAEHGRLLDAARSVITRVVERYRGRAGIVAWQVEHEAVDPLGMEHSWRLAEAFAAAEVAAVRAADPGRPVLMNGFLPTSTPVALQQRWRTRDQGDSLAVAVRLADIVGLDIYPRHALAAAGPVAVYLDGTGTRACRRRLGRVLGQARAAGRRLTVTEGQAEPWEAVTTPPSPAGRAMYSCPPEGLIANYNRCLGELPDAEAYLFWGAEYWLLRDRQGDPSYLRAFARVLAES